MDASSTLEFEIPAQTSGEALSVQSAIACMRMTIILGAYNVVDIKCNNPGRTKGISIDIWKSGNSGLTIAHCIA